jgi:hypothetical protein
MCLHLNRSDAKGDMTGQVERVATRENSMKKHIDPETQQDIQSARTIGSVRFRFRSVNGQIYSTDQQSFTPRLTTTRTRKLLNDLYTELAFYNKSMAEAICKRHNA